MVAVARSTFDEAVESQPAQIVCHLTLGRLLGCPSEEGRDVVAQIAIAKTTRRETKYEERSQECHGAMVTETNSGGTLLSDHLRLGDMVELIFGHPRVRAKSLDVEETPVGLEAHLSQFGEIADLSLDAEIVRVVDYCFGPQCSPTLEILLDARTLVIEVHRWNDSVRDHASSKASFCLGKDTTIEDELDVIGAA